MRVFKNFPDMDMDFQAPSSDGVAPGTVETESTSDHAVPYENVGLGAEGFASSVWSHLYIPEMAVIVSCLIVNDLIDFSS